MEDGTVEDEGEASEVVAWGFVVELDAVDVDSVAFASDGDGSPFACSNCGFAARPRLVLVADFETRFWVWLRCHSLPTGFWCVLRIGDGCGVVRPAWLVLRSGSVLCRDC